MFRQVVVLVWIIGSRLGFEFWKIVIQSTWLLRNYTVFWRKIENFCSGITKTTIFFLLQIESCIEMTRQWYDRAYFWYISLQANCDRQTKPVLGHMLNICPKIFCDLWAKMFHNYQDCIFTLIQNISLGIGYVRCTNAIWYAMSIYNN